MRKPKSITEIEKRICHEYLIDNNKLQACVRAGFTDRDARGHAYRIFERPRVIAYLKPLLQQLHAKTQVSAERVLEEMGRIAFANLADFYKPKGKTMVPKELHELTPAQQACLAEYIPGKHIKLHSKDGALDKLGKHFKLYTDLEAGITQFVVMPVLKISGMEAIFNVGLPAPKIAALEKN